MPHPHKAGALQTPASSSSPPQASPRSRSVNLIYGECFSQVLFGLASPYQCGESFTVFSQRLRANFLALHIWRRRRSALAREHASGALSSALCADSSSSISSSQFILLLVKSNVPLAWQQIAIASWRACLI